MAALGVGILIGFITFKVVWEVLKYAFWRRCWCGEIHRRHIYTSGRGHRNF